MRRQFEKQGDTVRTRGPLKQECPLAFVVLAWLLYVGGVVFLVLQAQLLLAAAWLLAAPVLMWAYVRWFSSISRYLGYGSVADRPAAAAPRVPVDVTLYTALGCPFCPIVKRRLRDLAPEMGFRLHEVDVTVRPEVLVRKGIWSVPVVEVGERRLVGHATSAQLVSLVTGGAVPVSGGERRPG